MRIIFLTPFLFLASALHADEEAPQSHNFTGEIVQMVISLIGIIVCVAFVGFILKRFMTNRMQSANDSNAIKILDRRALSPKSALYLVEILGKKFVISESHAGVHNIGDLPHVEKPFDEKVVPQETPSFATILKQKLKFPLSRSQK